MASKVFMMCMAAFSSVGLDCPLQEGAEKELSSFLQFGVARGSEANGSGHLEESNKSLPRKQYGVVSRLYTYGAVGASKYPLPNKQSLQNCFQGLRTYTERIFGVNRESRQVDAASLFTGYPHAMVPTLALHEAEDSTYTECPGAFLEPQQHEAGTAIYQDWPLHHEDHYRWLDRVRVHGKHVSKDEPFASAIRFRALAFKAYDEIYNFKTYMRKAMPGWSVVGHADFSQGTDHDPVWLAQHSNSLDCAVVFTGTNSAIEFSETIDRKGTLFCGFPEVHQGYARELRSMMADHKWKKLQAKLSKCNSLSVVGHSLGGALAELFSACVNSRNNHLDFNRIKWEVAKPEALPPVHP
mmetsp:Transcript_81347/g.143556  ORF Transcript_81347/g.143556 Transcript_81347/m.143556 type:complete len:354 (-) Transcript_81347:25-1086(-)